MEEDISDDDDNISEPEENSSNKTEGTNGSVTSNSDNTCKKNEATPESSWLGFETNDRDEGSTCRRKSEWFWIVYLIFIYVYINIIKYVFITWLLITILI